MKQKMVIRVWETSEKKSRSKALQTAAGVPGVESVTLAGEHKNQIVVIGDSTVDSVDLTCLLRKKLGSAELLSVSQIDEKSEEKKKAEAVFHQKIMSEPGLLQAMVWSTPYQPGVPHYYYSGVHEDKTNSDLCSIM